MANQKSRPIAGGCSLWLVILWWISALLTPAADANGLLPTNIATAKKTARSDRTIKRSFPLIGAEETKEFECVMVLLKNRNNELKKQKQLVKRSGQ